MLTNTVTMMTTNILANIHAELARTHKTDNDGNLVMTLDAIGLSAKIRYAILNGKPGLSRMDLVKAGTGKNNDDAAKWLRNNRERILEFSDSDYFTFRFQGTGQKSMPVVTFRQAMHILTLLPGEFAQKLRRYLLGLGHRYLAGDSTMKAEIDRNAVSTHVVNVAARASLSSTHTSVPLPRKLIVKYIYATQTPVFPGAIKIGRAKNVKARINSGNTFIKLAPHKVVAVARSLNSVRDEQLVHTFFASKRLKGEFFKVTVEEVREFFEKQIERTFSDEMLQSKHQLLWN